MFQQKQCSYSISLLCVMVDGNSNMKFNLKLQGKVSNEDSYVFYKLGTNEGAAMFADSTSDSELEGWYVFFNRHCKPR